MKIIIRSNTKKQKEEIHKYIIKAIKMQISLFGVSDILYHGCEWSNTKGDKTKGTDFQGCEIQIIDTWSNTDITKKIKERK